MLKYVYPWSKQSIQLKAMYVNEKAAAAIIIIIHVIIKT